MNVTTPMEKTLLESLGAMRPGTRGRIVHFEADTADGSQADLADRLREIGFAENLEVEVLHQSPFGRDPIAVRVGKMTIALRRKEANIVKVQLV
ncbi:FeoA family protein [Kordiimonas gwangyangensis]|uniref:FeoA family protein n=2 Tax=Kordiimonas gwangyangensis TaxID=288022 RepID=UPI0003A7BC1F|nr:FeoA family protein [Kordiimonas gwangyangensis]